MLPNGVNIPMPRPCGPYTPPTITIKPKADGTEGRDISVQLVGEIGDINQYTELIDVLDSASEKDSIRIMIDSPGGDVFTTQLLVERIESCKARVTTVASGLVASAATFLWFYGHDKEVDRWSRFMHHSSLHGDWGKSLAIKEHATELVNYMASILTDEMKAGILLAQEVQKILVNKADVEIAGATMKARVAKIKAEGGEVGDPNAAPAAEPVVEPAAEPATADDPNAAPAGDDPAAAPAETTEQPAAVPAEGGGEGGEVVDLARVFAEELGIEAPPPVETPDNQPTPGGEPTTTETTEEPAAQPAEPTAPVAKKAAPKKAVKCPKCGKTPCKCKKVKGEGEEEPAPAPAGDPGVTPVAPAEEPATPAQEPAPAEEPAGVEEPAVEPSVTPVQQPGENGEPAETGEVNPDNQPDDPNAVPPVTAKKCGGCGKKGKSKKAKIGALFAELGKLLTEGDTADSDVTVGEEPEGAEPEQGNPVEMGGDGKGEGKEAGQTGEETNTPKEVPVFDLGKIFDEEGLPGIGTGEGDPVKTDPGTTVVAPEKDAEKNANVETVTKGPEARVNYYW